MKLSESLRASTWLNQFDQEDQPYAAQLLDQLRFVPGATVTDGIRKIVEASLSSGEMQTPVAAVPVLSLEDMSGFDPKQVSAPVVFEHFQPSQMIADRPGSEALIAHLIREMTRSCPSGTFAASPMTLKSLQEGETRTLLCVTDYIGSGQQVVNYVETWHRNRSLRSWRSFKWLRTVVVAYAATPAGKLLVEQSPYVDELKLIEIAPDIRHANSMDQKVIDICRVYAKRAGLRGALGYKDSAGLFASSSSVPNNLPAILIKRSRNWEPFFDGRSVSAALAEELESRAPSVDLPARLLDARQVRLAMRIQDGEVDQRWHNHIVVLALLPKSESVLAQFLGVGLPTVKRILRSLESLGLVDSSRRLTEVGKRALVAHRKKPRRTTAKLVESDSTYYPNY